MGWTCTDAEPPCTKELESRQLAEVKANTPRKNRPRVTRFAEGSIACPTFRQVTRELLGKDPWPFIYSLGTNRTMLCSKGRGLKRGNRLSADSRRVDSKCTDWLPVGPSPHRCL